MSGKLDLLVKPPNEDEFKFSKKIDENVFFGMKTDTKHNRGDYARVATATLDIISIDTEKYR